MFSNRASLKMPEVRLVSAVDDLLMQRVNGGDWIMVEGTLVHHILLCRILMQVESLTEICNSSDNGNEDSDDSEFPSVQ